MAEIILLRGRRWPMTPVDITRVLFGVGVGRWASIELAIVVASSRPPFPVTAFAQPELIMMDLMPSPPVLWSVFRLTVTGAAWNMFCVKTAAAEADTSDVIRARSGKRVFDALTPTWVPETRKPLG